MRALPAVWPTSAVSEPLRVKLVVVVIPGGCPVLGGWVLHSDQLHWDCTLLSRTWCCSPLIKHVSDVRTTAVPAAWGDPAKLSVVSSFLLLWATIELIMDRNSLVYTPSFGRWLPPRRAEVSPSVITAGRYRAPRPQAGKIWLHLFKRPCLC